MVRNVDLSRFMSGVRQESLESARAALQVLQLQQWQRSFNEGGQPSNKWPDLWANGIEGHYRQGGHPLRDTGQLAASGFIRESSIDGDTVTSTIASSAFYAIYHQTGFKTSGPNFIPLTRSAMRTHRDGARPSDEGLEQGVDYIMAWKGVEVPARPMIDYSDPVNVAEINDTIADAIRN